MKNSSTAAALAVVLGLALAPAAQAQSRETGVGKIIAEQGNAALKQIQAELRMAMQSWRPAASTPVPTPVVERRRTVDATGAGLADSASCAP